MRLGLAATHAIDGIPAAAGMTAVVARHGLIRDDTAIVNLLATSIALEVVRDRVKAAVDLAALDRALALEGFRS